MIEFLHPVNIRIEILVDGRIAGNGLCVGLLLCVEGHIVGNLGIHDILVRVVGASAGVLISLIDGIHILYAAHEVGDLGELCQALVEVNGEFRFADDTGLRSNDDDAIATPHAIDCGRGCILKYRNRLNILRVELAEAALYAIDEHQRALVAVGQRGQSANPDVRVVLAGKAGTLNRHHTRHAAGKHGAKVGDRGFHLVHL